MRREGFGNFDTTVIRTATELQDTQTAVLQVRSLTSPSFVSQSLFERTLSCAWKGSDGNG
eukprot:3156576-Rhodomonas_salina.1